MYHTKRIGVFISHIFGSYQRQVCQGIIDKAFEYGYTAEIFTSMDGENLGFYGIGEESILHIPNYDNLDGMVFASETYLSLDLRAKILENLQTACDCPIVEIAVNNLYFPTISLENNSTTRDLTSHLITEHGYSRICYLGCASEAFFSDAREGYYREAMKGHGLNVGTYDIYPAEYTLDSVSAALSHFKKNGKPDAVVCYNDRLALLFMVAAFASGYRIPEEIAITGCDDTTDGYNAQPVLTTVSFPVYQLGTTAVEQLIHLIDGQKIPAVTTVKASAIIRNSCGCNQCTNPNPAFFQHTLTNRITVLENSILGSMSMSAAFQHINDIDDGADLLATYIGQIDHCREFYLCLFADYDSVSNHILEITENEEESVSSNTILLKLAIRDGKRLPECSFKKHALLPEHILKNSESAYIYTPLFFEDKAFGYVALAYEQNRIDYHFQLVQWLLNINQMLQSICEAKRTGLLVNRLEDIYMKDMLTGLYNAHGYKHREPELLAQAAAGCEWVSCFIFDLDELKKINDQFGHEEGDFALSVVGQALENSAKSEDILARFGDDEFYLLARNCTETDAEKLVGDIYKYLQNYNRLSSKNYRIFVSSGYATRLAESGFDSNSVKELFAQANQNMKLEKKRK
ncbi:GGDEF domain-containing protein [Konateibacter massiliensis]|uniref:GGDEF domain-containing protein n=1 Tax=Konateibacter massiliensis TaxID=2002841 RepID=UPI000C155323|nr:GGDEF domain-containing protein [Konateibacter massiliensis]